VFSAKTVETRVDYIEKSVLVSMFVINILN